MKDASKTVTVSILDKQYQINCLPDEVESLKQSAAYVDGKMREIKSGSNIVGLDRIAVMAALHIANDLIAESAKTASVRSRHANEMKSLSRKIEQTLVRLKSPSG